MEKRKAEEIQAYADGYNECFKMFNCLLHDNEDLDDKTVEVIRKMELITRSLIAMTNKPVVMTIGGKEK